MIDTVIHSDCLTVLRGMADNSVDAIVSDPPSSIHFMGRDWDSDKGGRDQWIAWLAEIMVEAKRVLKPGGHALIWALPRTSHWTATALEDAGFEIRDVITHLFGSGFPKSLDISKAIDRMQGKEREVVGFKKLNERDKVAYIPHAKSHFGTTDEGKREHEREVTKPATPEAQQWAGYGSALKPAAEFWWLCRKPLAESSIAAQVLATGTGGLNIGQTRVGLNGEKQPTGSGDRRNSSTYAQDEYTRNHMHNGGNTTPTQGRFPSHLLLSHSLWCVPRGTKRVRGNGRPNSVDNLYSDAGYGGRGTHAIGPQYNDEHVEAYECAPDCPIAELDRQSGVRKSGSLKPYEMHNTSSIYGNGKGIQFNDGMREVQREASEGFASRYFTNFPPSPDSDDYTPYRYIPKASRAERNAGLLLDSSEIVMIQLSHNSQTGGIEWEKQGQRARLQVDTAQSRPKVIGVSGTTTNDVQEWNTFLFGNDTMEPSLKECKFTIETKTSSITTSKTLNWLIRSLTNGSIVDVNSEMVNGGSHAASVKSSIQSVTIMSESMVSLPGVGNVPARTPLTISISEKLEHNNIDFGTMKAGGSGKPVPLTGLPLPRANVHPCVKPLALMRWLIRLITPPNGIVLDPFCGSGSTCVAAIHEGKHFIGIEQSEEYCTIANARIEYARTHEPDVVQVATKKVKGNGGGQANHPDDTTTRNAYGVYTHRSPVIHQDQEGMEEVEDWDCAPDCPVRILGEQSGVTETHASGPKRAKNWQEVQQNGKFEGRQGGVYGVFNKYVSTNEASTGTAARYFQTFAPDLWTQDMQDAEEVFIAEGGYEGEVSA